MGKPRGDAFYVVLPISEGLWADPEMRRLALDMLAREVTALVAREGGGPVELDPPPTAPVPATEVWSDIDESAPPVLVQTGRIVRERKA